MPAAIEVNNIHSADLFLFPGFVVRLMFIFVSRVTFLIFAHVDLKIEEMSRFSRFGFCTVRPLTCLTPRKDTRRHACDQEAVITERFRDYSICTDGAI